MQFERKLMAKPDKMAENLIFGLILAQICSQLFFVGFTSTRCYTLLQAIIVYNFIEN